VANPDIPTHIVGTANPDRILQNIREIEEPIDTEILAGVQKILEPVRNMTWPSGRPENNPNA
jgi:L-galactose dehydrogenase